MATAWYCTVQGNISGPHTATELRERAERGDLPPDAMIRRGTAGKWVRADSVGGLKFATEPALTTFRVKGPDRQSGPMREVVITAGTQDHAHQLVAEAGIVTGTAHDAVVATQHAQRQAELPPVPPAVPAKYSALAVLVEWYRFLAVVSGLAAAAGVVFGAIIADKNAGPGVAVMAGSAVWGALTVVSLLALAEGISLMRDVELTLREIRDRLPAGGSRPVG